MGIKHIATLAAALALALAAAAQERIAQNKPYIDLRPLHFGILVGVHLQDIELQNVGPQTVAAPDGTQQEQTILCDADNWNPGFSVGVLAELRLNANLSLRFTPTMHFGAKHLRFIKLSQTEASLAPSDTVRLTAQILPANATDPTVVWSTSDESIATVDETGLVTALAEGTATITARSQDGNAEATCTITVETGEPTTGIDAVTAEEVEIEVYNLHGHQVGNTTEDLPAGVYIIKEGNRTYKTVVR